MVQKRPFYDEELYSISSKHPRQVDYKNQLLSFSEFVPAEVASVTYIPGEGGLTENASEGHGRLASDVVPRFPVSSEKGVEITVPGSSLNSTWGAIDTTKEAPHPEMPVYISYPPEYIGHEHPRRTVSRHEDIYSILLHYPPRKAVPIGSNHQADIPEWSPYDCKTKLKSSGAHETFLDAYSLLREKDESRLMGTCVVPMPDLELADEVGNDRIDCSCLDDGSIRCVRQHIVEAREKLKRILGEETFEQLGFCEMGEQVADKWSKHEEQLFHEIVFSNPVSLGKNFWEHLSFVFPSRNKKDIVCYYFNVFMLRRRAEQNRSNSMNIDDSDNDEWQGSDDYGDNELGMTEEDGDSVVESPMHQDDCTHDQSWKDDLHVCDESVADDSSNNCERSDFACDRDITDFLETCPSMSVGNCGSKSKSHLLDKLSSGNRVNQVVQDDSCTSSDTGFSSEGTQVRAENGDHWPCSGLSCENGQDHALEPCDVKVWDAGYMICPKGKVDFLPTCSMIEEVFGEGSWNYKARDDKSLS